MSFPIGERADRLRTELFPNFNDWEETQDEKGNRHRTAAAEEQHAEYEAAKAERNGRPCQYSNKAKEWAESNGQDQVRSRRHDRRNNQNRLCGVSGG